MSVVTRGIKNAFRNSLRTLAVVLILAIGIGLSLSMLVANEAVTAKINDLKTQVGTTLTVHPAGGRMGEGGGEPLTTDDLAKVSQVAHVAHASAVMNFMVQNENSVSSGPGFMVKIRGGGDQGKTSLQSAIEPGTLGRRGAGVDAGASLPENFSLPITGTGSHGTDATGAAYKITAGRNITKDDSDYVAIIGTDLAAKNNLSVDSTFTAYDKTFKVVGIYDQGTKFDNSGFAIPLSVAQTLTNTAGEIGSIVVTVDSAENLDATKAAITAALGESRADVTSPQQSAQAAVESLKGVQQISIIAFVGALVAAAVIIFLIMLMVVRERKREIGVLKAIGGSNRTIVTQFMVEALVLVLMGTIVGLGITLVSSGGIATALVDSNIETTTDQTEGPQLNTNMSPGNAIKLGEGPQLQSASALVGQVAANVGWTTVIYGFLAAIAIAVLGSAVPAWLIAHVRPAEVMRGE